MPTTINKDDARRGVRDASEELVKPAAGPPATGLMQMARLPGKTWPPGATQLEITRKPRNGSSNKAAESLRGTMETSTGALGDVAGATRQVTSRAAEQFSQISALQSKVSKEASDRTLQNLQAMMQTGAK